MRKNFTALIIAVACLLMTATLAVNTVAYAAIDKDVIFKPGTGLGGGGIVVYVDDSHIDEAENFATIDRPTKSLKCHGYVQDVRVSKPDRNSDYNNIDDVIFMIGKLEKLAMEYANNDRRKANNCVLGYIRGINKNYTSKAENGNGDMYEDGSGSNFDLSELVGGKWGATAGELDKDFVSYVASKEKSGEITFPEFFASFLQGKDNYNSYFYGAVDSSFVNKRYKVPDPLGTGQSIDLTHMFAVMDGVYQNTGYNSFACKMSFGNTTLQRDLASWSGDLQQLIASFRQAQVEEKTYTLADGYIEFNTYLGDGSGFSSDDLLADIDGFNIAKFFIDCEKNSISNSMYGYYNCINKNKAAKGNRFYEFIYTVTRELQGSKQSTNIESFRQEICNAVNVGYKSGKYFEENIHSGMAIAFMGEDAPFETRKICAKLFCDYIVKLSGRGD